MTSSLLPPRTRANEKCRPRHLSPRWRRPICHHEHLCGVRAGTDCRPTWTDHTGELPPPQEGREEADDSQRLDGQPSRYPSGRLPPWNRGRAVWPANVECPATGTAILACQRALSRGRGTGLVWYDDGEFECVWRMRGKDILR
jgi:hypothetical protein